MGQEIVSQAVLDDVHELGVLRLYLEFAYLQCWESDLATQSNQEVVSKQ